MWTTDFIKLLGYEIKEYDINENTSEKIIPMIEAVKNEIDNGRPVLVWHAFTNAEWDVVCGYDEEKLAFLGRGSYLGLDNYASEPWDRAARAVEFCPAFGAVVIGKKISSFDTHDAEVAALTEAVRHGRDSREPEPDGKWTMYQGIQCYRKWADDFAKPGKDRGVGDAYCFAIYSFTHRAAADFLREIAGKYDAVSNLLLEAADFFEKETAILKSAENLLWWNSPGGIDEDRSRKTAPILSQCADAYEAAIDCIEKALPLLSMICQGV
jgi:hypothetical protein